MAELSHRLEVVVPVGSPHLDHELVVANFD